MSGRKIRTLSTRSSHEVSRKPPSESRHFALHQLRGSRITRGCSVPLAFGETPRSSGERSTCHVGSGWSQPLALPGLAFPAFSLTAAFLLFLLPNPELPFSALSTA